MTRVDSGGRSDTVPPYGNGQPEPVRGPTDKASQARLSDFGKPPLELAQVRRTGRRYAKNESWAWGWGGAVVRFYGDENPPAEIESWAYVGPSMNIKADTDEVRP